MAKEAAATGAVLKYFENQNRPYSAQDVFMNLHKEHGKPVIQRVIDQLVAENKLSEKVNGKQKCYVFNQNDMPSASEDELVLLDKECATLAETLASKQDELKQLDSKVKKLNSALTSQEAEEKLAVLEEEILEMEERLDKLKNETVLITPEEKAKINKGLESAVATWRKRKRMCMNALDSILESWPKKKKDLLDEIGIETDESVGAVFPS